MNLLVTGGAGFIGTHLVRRLLEAGHEVRVVDALAGDRPVPAGFDDLVFIHGDVGRPRIARAAVQGVDCVLHLAAAPGPGPSTYEPDRFVAANSQATAVLLRAAVDAGVRRVITASSLSVYGEGAYVDPDGRMVEARRPERPSKGAWDPVGPDGQHLDPAATPETKTPDPRSVHALTKWDQERLTLMLARSFGIEALALRIAPTYGPGQPLQGPGAGVFGSFCARLLNDQPPVVFEDGQQIRDLIHVDDVARALAMAAASDASGLAINIASGEPRTVLELATRLTAELERDVEPTITQESRPWDVRHCWADVRLAKEALAFEPRVAFDKAVRGLAGWLVDQHPVPAPPSTAPSVPPPPPAERGQPKFAQDGTPRRKVLR